MSRKVTLVEVGPRDGLQNEKTVLDLQTRLELVERLAVAGLRKIEIAAFVSPRWVPQMAGSSDLMKEAASRREKKVSVLAQTDLSALVPNPQGMQEALEAGVKHVAIFGSATESFARKNINCSIEESFSRFSTVMEMAAENKARVRGYLSVCFGCPFEGAVAESKVVRLTKRLLSMGVYEVSIGDTIGVANPRQVKSLVRKLVDAVGPEKIAMHFHDTRGTALANLLPSLELGVRTFDTSIGGLGGCPYAPAATGNLATEDAVYMLHGMGYQTGISLDDLLPINHWLAGQIGHDLPSRVGRAGLPKPRPI
jgi:hydroxymethylglutaryl-CoA lyase